MQRSERRKEFSRSSRATGPRNKTNGNTCSEQSALVYRVLIAFCRYSFACFVSGTSMATAAVTAAAAATAPSLAKPRQPAIAPRLGYSPPTARSSSSPSSSPSQSCSPPRFFPLLRNREPNVPNPVDVAIASFLAICFAASTKLLVSRRSIDRSNPRRVHMFFRSEISVSKLVSKYFRFEVLSTAIRIIVASLDQ